MLFDEISRQASEDPSLVGDRHPSLGAYTEAAKEFKAYKALMLETGREPSVITSQKEALEPLGLALSLTLSPNTNPNPNLNTNPNARPRRID